VAATEKLSEFLPLPAEERAKLALELIRSLDGGRTQTPRLLGMPRSTAVEPQSDEGPSV
jgi:hypothetical protein